MERWCRRVLLTNCKAVGAKLIITNGEEYEQLNKMEDIVCCVACYPVWLIQTGIYKVQSVRIYHECESRIEKIPPEDHCLASRGLPSYDKD